MIESEPQAPFRQELDALVQSIASAGFVNGLSQTVLKMTLPGVPDFYQGTELWDFNLVDPDNRRPVDFTERRRLLAEVSHDFAEKPSQLAEELGRRSADPRIKMLLIWRTLHFRLAEPELFATGDYLPLAVTGARATHVLAFARRQEHRWAVVATPLRVRQLSDAKDAPSDSVPSIDWANTAVALPADAPVEWRNEFTGELIDVVRSPVGKIVVPVADILSPLPVALLSSFSG